MSISDAAAHARKKIKKGSGGGGGALHIRFLEKNSLD